MADRRSGKRRRREVMARERIEAEKNGPMNWNPLAVSDEARAAVASIWDRIRGGPPDGTYLC